MGSGMLLSVHNTHTMCIYLSIRAVVCSFMAVSCTLNIVFFFLLIKNMPHIKAFTFSVHQNGAKSENSLFLTEFLFRSFCFQK